MTTRIEPSRELALQEQTTSTPAVMEEMSFTQLETRMEKIQQAIGHILKPDIDFGIVPGTSRKNENGEEMAKPSLFKSGAEKLAALFLFDAEFENELVYSGPESNQHLTVTSRCTLYHIPTGRRVGSGSAICSTKESKYAERVAGLKCPKCAKENIRKSNRKGWYCWTKTGGCGTNFEDGDPAIETQPRGKIPNDKLADSYNTVIKMAEKRAKVGAVIGATGASEFVTQDLEEFEQEEGTGTTAGTASNPTGAQTDPGQGSAGKKKTGSKPSGAPKAAQGSATTSAGDKISAEQIEVFKETCTELDYDPEEVLANYQRFDSSIKEIADLQVGMFRNFLDAADRKRKQKEAQG